MTNSHGGLHNLDGFIHSVNDTGSPVKEFLKTTIDTMQFKHWFEDWQNDQQNASKVVAEMCETMLTGTDAAARMPRKLYDADRSQWEKVKEFFITKLLYDAVNTDIYSGCGVFNIDKNKTTAYLTKAGLQLPGVLRINDGLIHTITGPKSSVK